MRCSLKTRNKNLKKKNQLEGLNIRIWEEKEKDLVLDKGRLE